MNSVRLQSSDFYPFLGCLHVILYVFIAPFLGGALISFLKYRAETEHSFETAIFSAGLAGLFAIFFYWFWGLVFGLCSLPFIVYRWTNLCANLCASYFFISLVIKQSPDFFAGYEFFMRYVGMSFGLTAHFLYLLLRRHFEMTVLPLQVKQE